MALLIDIVKLEQTEKIVRYKYYIYTTPEDYGVLEIDLDSEKVYEVKQAPNDPDKILFNRAAMKIAKHWENGNFPDKTCWAS